MLNSASKKNAQIAIIGAGVVGLAVGKVLRKAKFPVVFVDINPVRVKELSKKKINATENIYAALEGSAFSFICVSTPSSEEDGSFDGSMVLDVFSKILTFLEKMPPRKRQENFHTIVIKSTVLPEFMTALPKLSKLKLGKDYGLVFNPEFLRSESAQKDVAYEQIIIGSKDKHSARAVKLLYQKLEKALKVKFRYLLTDFTSAALLKYKHNLWLAATMGYLMEFAKVCQFYGVDPHQIIKGTPNHDPAVWVRDDFLSNGFLDECLPKDSSAFQQAAKKNGVPLTVLESATKVNQQVIHKKHPVYDIQRFRLLSMIHENGD